jgi:hypothetical protein
LRTLWTSVQPVAMSVTGHEPLLDLPAHRQRELHPRRLPTGILR